MGLMLTGIVAVADSKDHQRLHLVSRAMLTELAGPVPATVEAGDLVTLDAGDTIRAVHGSKKRGVRKRGAGAQNALVTVISTPSPPLIAECSLRRCHTHLGEDGTLRLTRALSTAAHQQRSCLSEESGLHIRDETIGRD